jgi:hypothetical protein
VIYPLNWLQTPTQQRPNLPTRTAGGSAIEVQCPVCGQWRAGFALLPFAQADVARFGDAWGCDNERSILLREAAAAAEAALPPRPPVLPLFDYLRLWTQTEALAVEASTDADLRWAYLLVRSLQTVDLGVSEVQAGIARALALGILTEARAARIAAGLPPL